MSKKLLLTGLLTTLCATIDCKNVHAQSVDYGSLQDLFGEPVTTSATGTPQRAGDVAADMTIITADQIRQSGTRVIPLILGMYVPGLDVLQTGIDSFDVGVRGYQQPFQPRLLVLVDGRQVFVDDYSRTEWGNLPVNTDDIRQIEVVIGPASALFGSNAAGGVINIITYSPLYDNDRVAAIGGGTQNTVTGDATVTQHFGDWGGVKLSAGGMNATNFSTSRPAAENRYGEEPAHHYAAEDSVFKINSNLQTNLELTYSQTDLSGVSLLYTLTSNTYTNYSVKGGFSWQTPYGLIVNTNYFNHSDVQAAFPLSSDFISSTDLIVSRLEDQFQVGSDNTFRAALEYRHKSFSEQAYNNIDVPQSPDLATDIYAVGGTWLWKISDNLSWTNAARVDHTVTGNVGLLGPDFLNSDLGHSENALSANSGLVYQATDLDTLRATYGRGVQIPSLIQTGISFAAPLGPVVVDSEGNAKLKPTIVQNYEIDYDRKVPDIFSTVRFSVYYQTNQDVISPPSTIGTRIIGGQTWLLSESTNIGNSDGWGGEIEISGKHPDGFRWDASYSYARVVDSPAVSTDLDYSGSTPQHHIRLNGGYTTGAWEFDADTQILSSSDMLRSFNGGSTIAPSFTDGYVSVGGRIGYNFYDNFTLALSGTNITNHAVSENPYPTIERQVFLTLTGKF